MSNRPNQRNADPLADYVDVPARIQEFFEKYPDGCLRRDGDWEVKEVGGKTFIVYKALAYRSPRDLKPAQGTAWEPFPGPTNFTRDSELMNAETAAWGRALVALGIAAKKVVTRRDVEKSKAQEEARGQTNGEPQTNGETSLTPEERKALYEAAKAKGKTEDQWKLQMTALGVKKPDELTPAKAEKVMAWLA